MTNKFIGTSSSIVQTFNKLKSDKRIKEQNNTSWFDFNYRFIDSSSTEKFHLIILNYPIVCTNRYVWHISRKENRKTILELGIVARHPEGGVWANNAERIDHFYPWIIDGTDFVDYTEMDFWQIDTWKINHTWRVDPFMHCIDGTPSSRRNYICTKNNIPKHAITLYNFEYSFYTTHPTSSKSLYKTWLNSLHVKNLKRIN